MLYLPHLTVLLFKWLNIHTKQEVIKSFREKMIFKLGPKYSSIIQTDRKRETQEEKTE
jgi:hypothetical protein